MRHVKVCDATDNSQWRFGGGRTRVFQDLIAQIQEQPIPATNLGPDIFCGSMHRVTIRASFKLVEPGIRSETGVRRSIGAVWFGLHRLSRGILSLLG